MGNGLPYVPPNPWVWAAYDRNGIPLTISIPWNTNTRGVQGGNVTRTTGCELTTIYIGLGPDGTPNTAANVYTVAEGETSFAANVLRNNGLNTIDDVLALQITAA